MEKLCIIVVWMCDAAILVWAWRRVFLTRSALSSAWLWMYFLIFWERFFSFFLFSCLGCSLLLNAVSLSPSIHTRAPLVPLSFRLPFRAFLDSLSLFCRDLSEKERCARLLSLRVFLHCVLLAPNVPFIWNKTNKQGKLHISSPFRVISCHLHAKKNF